MPSTADLESPIGPQIERYYQGAEGMPGAERVALYKLAWDLCGEAFGMRQLQYERYYAADPGPQHGGQLPELRPLDLRRAGAEGVGAGRAKLTQHRGGTAWT